MSKGRGYINRPAQRIKLSAVDLLEDAGDAFIALDDGFRIVYANRAACRIVRRPFDELVGALLWEQWPVLIGTEAERQLRRTVSDRTAVHFEHRSNAADYGAWLEIHAYPCGVGVGVFFRDITSRKAADEVLAGSEEQLRLATEGAGIGIWKVSFATDEVACTPLGWRLFGFPEKPGGPIPLSIVWAAMHPDDIEAAAAALDCSRRDGTELDLEFRMFNADGSVRWVRAQGRPQLDCLRKVESLQGVVSDITQRKISTENLAVAADRFERIAEILQRSMLVGSPTGALPGISVESFYKASLNEAEVGGDFFDAISLSSEEVVLVVGDVSGKGLPAAARTSEIKYALRALLHDKHSPDVALSHLNDFICDAHLYDCDDWETFVVLSIVVLNTRTGEAAFSAAGAEPSLILRTSGNVDPIAMVGIPVGIEPGASYELRHASLGRGDTLLMVTDGITEARMGGEFLGIDGVAHLARQAGPSTPLTELSQAVYRGALSFSQGELRDDVCLLLARL